MSVFDTQTDSTRDEALETAAAAVREGKLIVLPTDTVYGIGADAFSPEAVEDLREAKGRGRSMPPPVLIGDPAVLMALAIDMPDYVEDLAEAFWPGPLTLILQAQPSLTWDLGETRGTVALRMPDDEVALELLRRTGPLAVSSANRTGKSPALTVLDAATQLGDAVEVYLDGGTAPLGESSTIIDTTVTPPEIVRQGALTTEAIIEKVGDIFAAPEPEVDPADAAPQDAQGDVDPETPEVGAPETGDSETETAGTATLDSGDADAEAAEGATGDAGHVTAGTPGHVSGPDSAAPSVEEESTPQDGSAPESSEQIPVGPEVERQAEGDPDPKLSAGQDLEGPDAGSAPEGEAQDGTSAPGASSSGDSLATESATAGDGTRAGGLRLPREADASPERDPDAPGTSEG